VNEHRAGGFTNIILQQGKKLLVIDLLQVSNGARFAAVMQRCNNSRSMVKVWAQA
jgi:hypothetical protein